ncbi:MAG: ribosomal protein S18-alanine N-acetyltransferase [Fimbriimonadaceae bacterium]|nr:ribosomal protein S18-alanine N-acetyltransferase [Fimbriimonadaceae bacterium]
MLKTLRFEPLEERHLTEVMAIEHAINPAPWSEDAFRNELTHANSIFRVALVEGRVAGYVDVWMVVDEAHITNVAVREELRRNGIGRRLVRIGLEEAKARGAVAATLEVRASNAPAIQLYEQMGFVRAAVRRSYYPDNREDAVVMWLYRLDEWDVAAR